MHSLDFETGSSRTDRMQRGSSRPSTEPSLDLSDFPSLDAGCYVYRGIW